MYKRTLSIMLSIFIVILTVSGTFIVSAEAASEVKGKTISQVLGMDGGVYMEWLQSHENDSYYRGTPYGDGDYRNPKGDCKGTYGYSDVSGKAAMNCTGFVWHVLMKATKASGGNSSIIPAMSGWVSFYRRNNISRRYFNSKSEMLNSGYLEKGDIIWMFQYGSEATISDDNHIGIYWGDGSTDVFWHSLNAGGNLQGNIRSKIIPKQNNNVLYVAVKVGAEQRGYIKVIKTSTDNSVTEGNDNYSFEGIEYYVSQSNTDFDPSGNNYLGYIKLNAAGEGHSKNGSRETLRKLKPGTYYVKEGYIPSGSSYERNDTVYTVTVTKNHTTAAPLVLRVSDKPKTCYGKLVKSSKKPEWTDGNPDYSFAGIRYSFSKSSTDFSPQGDKYIGYVELDENGIGYTANGSRDTLRKLAPGTYYVKESVIPAGCKYKLDNTVYTMTFTFENSQNNLKVLNVKDEPEGSSSAKIIKKSSLPEITNGNTEYSLEGAEFTVYGSRSDAEQNTNPYTSVVTDENGISSISDIEIGTYYVRETKAPYGFELSEEIKELNIEAVQEEAYTVEFEDKPIITPISVLLRKVAADDSEEYDMSGAQYTVNYFNSNYDSLEDLAGVSPTRTWVFGTDAFGNIGYTEYYHVSGDELYYDPSVNVFGLPLGTITVQETKAPKDFYLDEQVYLRQITLNSDSDVVTYNNPVSTEESISPVNISGKKTWSDDNNRDGKRPKSVTVQLYRDNEPIDSFTMNDENGWMYQFNNLDKGYADLSLDNHFHEYRYEVKEGQVEYYTSDSTGLKPDPADENHYICDFTNHYTVEKIPVSGVKTWDDYNDVMKYRPATIKVILYRDNVKVDEVTTGEAENWAYSFPDQYKYHDGGVAYTYTVGEETVSGYTVKVDGYNLKNTLDTGSVRLRKTDENDNSLEGVIFALFTEYGKPVSSVTNGESYRFWELTENEEEAEYTTNADGDIFIEELPYGKYYFEETKTLLGFIPYGEKMWFEISGDSDETQNVTVDAENAGMIMPETGGFGNYRIYLLSITFAGLGIMMLCIYKHKKSIMKGNN